MGIEALSPWVSLVAGALSIAYLVADEWRTRSAADDHGADAATASGRPSLAAAVRAHDTVVVTAVTMFFVAGLAHWYLRSTAYFYPVAIWGTAGFVVVATAIGEVAEE